MSESCDKIDGSRGRVAIIGGSISGCAAAIAMGRAGFEPLVFERSHHGLRGRGAGIAIPYAVRDALVAAGYLDSSVPFIGVHTRNWVVRDTRCRNDGYRVLWRQPSPAVATDWGLLWRALRAKVPDRFYSGGTECSNIVVDDGGPSIAIVGEYLSRVKLLIGADGYGSLVRRVIHPVALPIFAGYAAWRGICDETELSGNRILGELLSDGWVTVCFSGGHGVFFLIPGEEGSLIPGERCINWVIYCKNLTIPPKSAGSVTVDESRLLTEAMHDRLPTQFMDVVEATSLASKSVHDVQDISVPDYGHSRTALIGDAATVSRPHASSGVSKALQDAMVMERSFTSIDSIPEALAAYSRERTASGNDLVALGRRMGLGLVDASPDWNSISQGDMQRWATTLLDGRMHYLYGDSTLPPR